MALFYEFRENFFIGKRPGFMTNSLLQVTLREASSPHTLIILPPGDG